MGFGATDVLVFNKPVAKDDETGPPRLVDRRSKPLRDTEFFEGLVESTVSGSGCLMSLLRFFPNFFLFVEETSLKATEEVAGDLFDVIGKAT
jgi:hypothetical protein